LPTWNYVRSDEETVKNYEEVFRRCGHEWGQEGRYRKVFESALYVLPLFCRFLLPPPPTLFTVTLDDTRAQVD
jgi:hypothetical protein